MRLRNLGCVAALALCACPHHGGSGDRHHPNGPDATTLRISRGSGYATEAAHDGPSRHAALTPDGRYVAFDSASTQIVPGDINGEPDVFLRDTELGTTERISVGYAGAMPDQPSWAPSISATGRYVAFHSLATTLILGDANSLYDVFVRDRQAGVTFRVSVDSAGTEAQAVPNGLLPNGPGSFWPSISADGRYVAFQSYAYNLVAGDTNNKGDIFVRDLVAGTTERVSVDSLGAQADGVSWEPSISADGRYVAFVSDATNLVAGDTNGGWDVFVHDRTAHTTIRVSVSSTGAESTQGAIDPGTSFVYLPVFEHPSITADGSKVVFSASSSDLVANDTNGMDDIFLRDIVAGTTTRISLNYLGGEAYGMTGPGYGSHAPTITSDGRFVAFASDAIDLVAGDFNNPRDAFVRDLLAGTTRKVSLTSEGGATVYGNSEGVVVSLDGRRAAFTTDETYVVPEDGDAYLDVFLRIPLP